MKNYYRTDRMNIFNAGFPHQMVWEVRVNGADFAMDASGKALWQESNYPD